MTRADSPLAQFRAITERSGDKTAFVDVTTPGKRRQLNYRETLDAAARLAALLGERVPAGARIAASLPNGIDLAIFYLACLHGGFSAVPVNPSLPPDIMSFITRASRATLLVADDTNLARIEAPCPILRVAGDGLLAGCRDHIPGAPSVDGDAILSITFTSGTVGRPKGVAHRVDAMLGNVQAFNSLAGLDATTRMLHVMPMCYMAGFLNTILSPLAAGGTVVLAPAFDAQRALAFWVPAMAEDVDTMWLTPTMAALLHRLSRGNEVPAWTRRTLRNVFVGTAPLSPATKAAFEERFGVECLESYGMTEVMLVSANSRLCDRQPASVGHLIDGVTVETRSADGTAQPPGTEGELWVATRWALEGYLTEENSEPASPLEDGWMPTGDIGRVDPDGHLYITGRLKDLIIVGGTNVSPRAIEEALLSRPGVVDAAVVGSPHPFWGEEPVAFLVLAGGLTLDAVQAGLTAHCRSVLPTAAVPARMIALPAFPRNPTGKVLKHELARTLS